MQLPDFQNQPFTDFSVPENREAFAAALVEIEASLGKTGPAWIGGEPVTDKPHLVSRDPGDLDRVVGTFQQLDADDANRAVEAASAAFPAWAGTPVEERVGCLIREAETKRDQLHLL